jgi:23S rRNA pseudouridine1911/1915/1917 synthase
MRPLNVIYEDDDLLVLNKPAGITVNRAETTRNQLTIEDWLMGKGINLDRHGLVHRLDKETSGLLLAAKTLTAQANLMAQFKNRQVRKTYLALVHGRLSPPNGNINLPIGRNPYIRRRFGIFIGGKPALTNYQTVSNFTDYTLLELNPQTGRTHQLRVHLKHLNHPLVSDGLYAGRTTANRDRRWCPRLFLHAASISFTHPFSGKKMEFKLSLPKDLQKVLDKLKKA